MIGPQQCCACDDTPGGQASAFLERLYPADGTTFEQVTRPENCKKGPIAADISLVVTRCYPTIDAQGNAPDLSVFTTAAEELNTDMAAAWNGLMCCGSKIVFRESAVDADPDGGCSAFVIRVTVLVQLPANPSVDVS
jgi:hypothetical protein